MYFRLVHHYPQQGKNTELRSLIEDFVKSENASGSSSPQAVFITMMEARNSIAHGIQHEDFEAWEKHVANRSPSFQAYGPKMQTLIEGNNLQVLYEVLAREASDKPRNYVWQTIHTPKQGEGPRLRRLLEERVKDSVERGSSSSTLLANAFDSTFSIAVTFSDLSGLETYRKSFQSDPATATWGGALSTASSGPAQQVLSRILVPFPPS